MTDGETSEGLPRQVNAGRQVRILEPQPPSSSVKWRVIRFIELIFAVSCLSSLMALYGTNPTYDDYTKICQNLVETVWFQSATKGDKGTTESLEMDFDEIKTSSDSMGFQKFPFRLSYAIVLFTLISTVLMVLLLDLLSRLFGEPINKLPMILMLAASEILCLIIMVLTMDMFLGAINCMIVAISALALGLSISFATDLVYTSVQGNGTEMFTGRFRRRKKCPKGSVQHRPSGRECQDQGQGLDADAR